jgi:hypothetical protein
VYCLVSSLLFGIVPGLVLNLPPSFVVLAHLSLSSSRCCPQSVNAAASCRGRSEGFVSSNRSPKKIQDAQRVRSNVRSRIQQSPCLARCCIAHNPRCYRQAAIMVNGEKRSQKELRTGSRAETRQGGGNDFRARLSLGKFEPFPPPKSPVLYLLGPTRMGGWRK